MDLPAELVVGVSTSAYQIEGAAREDGRGPSIWDTFCRRPGAVHGGDTGDVAADHYHRLEEDLDLLSWLGVDAYRFSVAWPRVQPLGSGPVNEAGLDFYRRLVEGLRDRGILAMATLYHWDLPQALEDEGGWRSRATAERFADYAAVVAGALDGAVSWWATLNEPWVAAHLGHHSGQHAPGLRDDGAAVAAAHHLLLGHGLAVDAIRANASGDVGLVVNSSPVRPASADPADVEAATRVDGVLTRWWLDAAVHGRYPSDILEVFERLVDLSFIRSDDLAAINRPLDFLGLNYYSPSVVAAGEDPARRPVGPGLDGIIGVDVPGERTAMGWRVDADSLRELLTRLAHDYEGLPLMVTENGAAYDDEVGSDGAVEDAARLDYIRTHLAATLAARDGGVSIGGYFVWSLMDNFEWADGYRRRFGIVRVDYDTLKRTPKRSAHWLRDQLAARRARS